MFYVNGSFSMNPDTEAHAIANGTGIGFHHRKQPPQPHMNVVQMGAGLVAGQKRAHDWDVGYAHQLQQQQFLTQMVPPPPAICATDNEDSFGSMVRSRKRRRCGEQSNEDDKIPRGKRKHPNFSSSAAAASPQLLSDENDQRKVANNRERQRTKELNVGFAELRNYVPMLPSDKQSKIQTLRLTSQYIQFLMDVLYRNEPNEQPISHLVDDYKKLLKYGFSTWRMQRDEIHDCETMS